MDEEWLKKIRAFRHAAQRLLALGVIGLILVGVYVYSEIGVLYGNYGIYGLFICFIVMLVAIIFTRSLSRSLRNLSICLLLCGVTGLIFWIRTDLILIHPIAAIMFIIFSPFPHLMGHRVKRDLEDTDLLNIR